MSSKTMEQSVKSHSRTPPGGWVVPPGRAGSEGGHTGQAGAEGRWLMDSLLAGTDPHPLPPCSGL